MNLAKYIDHTILKPDATYEMVRRLCEEAREYGFYSVCVNPCHVRLAESELENSDVKITTVVGFPLGANSSEVKAFEAGKAIAEGADEIDMVINIGALKSGDLERVKSDIEAVADICRDKAVLKTIIETCLLDSEEIVKVCEIARSCRVDFVKTSTGFGASGARVEDVKLMKETVGENIEVKASGGIRTREDALKFIEAGAGRIGTSNSIDIVQGK